MTTSSPFSPRGVLRVLGVRVDFREPGFALLGVTELSFFVELRVRLAVVAAGVATAEPAFSWDADGVAGGGGRTAMVSPIADLSGDCVPAAVRARLAEDAFAEPGALRFGGIGDSWWWWMGGVGVYLDVARDPAGECSFRAGQRAEALGALGLVAAPTLSRGIILEYRQKTRNGKYAWQPRCPTNGLTGEEGSDIVVVAFFVR
ncbi:hypothetical protein HOY82DRAFT_562233 [Tuber indicum]|nr:hypothetical protein HOY82DRAFT_562233 [Tuber indicum]